MATSAALGIIAASHGRWAPTPSNVRGLNAWIAAEKPAGQAWQWNNPLNTTDRWRSVGIAPYGPGISIFPNALIGALATVRTILGMDNMAGWPAIDASLRRGTLGRDLKANPGLTGNWGTNPSTIASLLGGTVPNSTGPSSSSTGKPLGIGGGVANLKTSLPKCSWWDIPCNVKQGLMSPLVTLGRWLETGAGGAVMLAGLGVILVGATGASNKVGRATMGALTGGPAGAAVGAATAPPRSDQVPAAKASPGYKLKAAPKPKAAAPAAAPATEEIDVRTPEGKARYRQLAKETA
jgi:hypothetical protein